MPAAPTEVGRSADGPRRPSAADEIIRQSQEEDQARRRRERHGKQTDAAPRRSSADSGAAAVGSFAREKDADGTRTSSATAPPLSSSTQQRQRGEEVRGGAAAFRRYGSRRSIFASSSSAVAAAPTSDSPPPPQQQQQRRSEEHIYRYKQGPPRQQDKDAIRGGGGGGLELSKNSAFDAVVVVDGKENVGRPRRRKGSSSSSGGAGSLLSSSLLRARPVPSPDDNNNDIDTTAAAVAVSRGTMSGGNPQPGPSPSSHPPGQRSERGGWERMHTAALLSRAALSSMASSATSHPRSSATPTPSAAAGRSAGAPRQAAFLATTPPRSTRGSWEGGYLGRPSPGSSPADEPPLTSTTQLARRTPPPPSPAAAADRKKPHHRDGEGRGRGQERAKPDGASTFTPPTPQYARYLKTRGKHLNPPSPPQRQQQQPPSSVPLAGPSRARLGGAVAETEAPQRRTLSAERVEGRQSRANFRRSSTTATAASSCGDGDDKAKIIVVNSDDKSSNNKRRSAPYARPTATAAHTRPSSRERELSAFLQQAPTAASLEAQLSKSGSGVNPVESTRTTADGSGTTTTTTTATAATTATATATSSRRRTSLALPTFTTSPQQESIPAPTGPASCTPPTATLHSHRGAAAPAEPTSAPLEERRRSGGSLPTPRQSYSRYSRTNSGMHKALVTQRSASSARRLSSGRSTTSRASTAAAATASVSPPPPLPPPPPVFARLSSRGARRRSSLSLVPESRRSSDPSPPSMLLSADGKDELVHAQAPSTTTKASATVATAANGMPPQSPQVPALSPSSVAAAPPVVDAARAARRQVVVHYTKSAGGSSGNALARSGRSRSTSHSPTRRYSQSGRRASSSFSRGGDGDRAAAHNNSYTAFLVSAGDQQHAPAATAVPQKKGSIDSQESHTAERAHLKNEADAKQQQQLQQRRGSRYASPALQRQDSAYRRLQSSGVLDRLSKYIAPAAEGGDDRGRVGGATVECSEPSRSLPDPVTLATPVRVVMTSHGQRRRRQDGAVDGASRSRSPSVQIGEESEKNRLLPASPLSPNAENTTTVRKDSSPLAPPQGNDKGRKRKKSRAGAGRGSDCARSHSPVNSPDNTPNRVMPPARRGLFSGNSSSFISLAVDSRSVSLSHSSHTAAEDVLNPNLSAELIPAEQLPSPLPQSLRQNGRDGQAAAAPEAAAGVAASPPSLSASPRANVEEEEGEEEEARRNKLAECAEPTATAPVPCKLSPSDGARGTEDGDRAASVVSTRESQQQQQQQEGMPTPVEAAYAPNIPSPTSPAEEPKDTNGGDAVAASPDEGEKRDGFEDSGTAAAVVNPEGGPRTCAEAEGSATSPPSEEKRREEAAVAMKTPSSAPAGEELWSTVLSSRQRRLQESVSNDDDGDDDDGGRCAGGDRSTRSTSFVTNSHPTTRRSPHPDSQQQQQQPEGAVAAAADAAGGESAVLMDVPPPVSPEEEGRRVEGGGGQRPVPAIGSYRAILDNIRRRHPTSFSPPRTSAAGSPITSLQSSPATVGLLQGGAVRPIRDATIRGSGSEKEEHLADADGCREMGEKNKKTATAEGPHRGEEGSTIGEVPHAREERDGQPFRSARTNSSSSAADVSGASESMPSPWRQSALEAYRQRQQQRREEERDVGHEDGDDNRDNKRKASVQEGTYTRGSSSTNSSRRSSIAPRKSAPVPVASVTTTTTTATTTPGQRPLTPLGATERTARKDGGSPCRTAAATTTAAAATPDNRRTLADIPLKELDELERSVEAMLRQYGGGSAPGGRPLARSPAPHDPQPSPSSSPSGGTTAVAGAGEGAGRATLGGVATRSLQQILLDASLSDSRSLNLSLSTSHHHHHSGHHGQAYGVLAGAKSTVANAGPSLSHGGHPPRGSALSLNDEGDGHGRSGGGGCEFAALDDGDLDGSEYGDPDVATVDPFDEANLWCGPAAAPPARPAGIDIPALDLSLLLLPDDERAMKRDWHIPMPTAVRDTPRGARAALLAAIGLSEGDRSSGNADDMDDYVAEYVSDGGEGGDAVPDGSVKTDSGRRGGGGGKNRKNSNSVSSQSQVQRRLSGSTASPRSTSCLSNPYARDPHARAKALHGVTGGLALQSTSPAVITTASSTNHLNGSNSKTAAAAAAAAGGGGGACESRRMPVRFTDESDALDGGRGVARERAGAFRVQRLLMECSEQRARKALLLEEADGWRVAGAYLIR